MSEPIAPRPRTKPAAVRREELLDAAQRLFLARGVAATSVDDIVAAADVAKGTFYLYFPSKEALIGGLRDRYVAGFRATLRDAVALRRAGDWRGKLRAWVEGATNDYLDRLALHDVIFHEAHAGNRHGGNVVVDDLAALLREGARAGAWSAEDPQLTALLLYHAMHGAVDEAVGERPPVDRKRLVAALLRFFRRALAA
ncbi:MAG: TetR/AcrR family transcriptional regulator [Vulcanimicrobiaceae bacterium]|jgi:AcrR family transcriptional regulator